MTKWHPIETAPEDKPVYLWDGKAVHQGCWVDVPFEEFRDAMGRYISQTDPWCGWVSNDTGDELEPTHWHEIVRPEPPQS